MTVYETSEYGLCIVYETSEDGLRAVYETSEDGLGTVRQLRVVFLPGSSSHEQSPDHR